MLVELYLEQIAKGLDDVPNETFEEIDRRLTMLEGQRQWINS